MLREEQYGGMPDRSASPPMRVLTEVMQDAMVTGKELHVFSADLANAFDSLEHWSRATLWRALGMSKRMVNLLAQIDETGETEVILGQGRTTTDTLEDKGRYKSDRGVRQGSIGGPIK